MIKQQFDTLLNKEMDRKDFLKYSVGVILAAVGVTGMIRLLLGQAGVSLPGHTGSVHSGKSEEGAGGYGASAYGR